MNKSYRWKSTEICHMERFRKDWNEPKEKSETIAGLKKQQRKIYFNTFLSLW